MRFSVIILLIQFGILSFAAINTGKNKIKLFWQKAVLVFYLLQDFQKKYSIFKLCMGFRGGGVEEGRRKV